MKHILLSTLLASSVFAEDGNSRGGQIMLNSGPSWLDEHLCVQVEKVCMKIVNGNPVECKSTDEGARCGIPQIRRLYIADDCKNPTPPQKETER